MTSDKLIPLLVMKDFPVNDYMLDTQSVFSI